MFSLFLAVACTRAELESPHAERSPRDTGGPGEVAPNASPALPSATSARPPAAPTVPRRTVVIGGGPAGLSAAMDLAGPVILL